MTSRRPKGCICGGRERLEPCPIHDEPVELDDEQRAQAEAAEEDRAEARANALDDEHEAFDLHGP
jgi:hypothetical protein